METIHVPETILAAAPPPAPSVAEQVLAAAVPSSAALKLHRIARHLIDVRPQARKHFDEGFIGRLAEAVRVKGQTWPVKVRPSATPGRWELVAGEQRLRAFDLAGVTTVFAIETHGDLTEADLLEEQLQENGLRADLRPCEEAEALEKLMQMRGCNKSELAAALKFTPAHVSRRLGLLRYTPEQRARIDADEVSEVVAAAIARLIEPDRSAMFERAARERWTREKALAAISALIKKRKSPTRASGQLKRLALRLGEQGGTLTLTAPDGIELTTEVTRDAVEFALKKLNRALKHNMPVTGLPAYFREPPKKKSKATADDTAPAAPEVRQPEPVCS